ncbi:MAG: toll/interleukin-1 receptor domain-containing protein, partial [Thermoanaerobaculia bacterium]
MSATVETTRIAQESKRRSYDVFLSYSSASQPWVRKFTDALTASGISAWFDAHEILPGERWQAQIEKALRQSRVLIMVLTSESVQRPWTFFELGAALAGGKRIIPVLSEDVHPADVPAAVRQFQFVR